MLFKKKKERRLTEGKTLSAGAKFEEIGAVGAVFNKPLLSLLASGINCNGKTGGIISPASAR